MADKVKTKEVVFDVYDEVIPQKADEYIKFWQEKLKLVPDEFIDSAVINVQSGSSYGDDYLIAELYYLRPETEFEQMSREAKEGRLKRQREASDLRGLERLKEKLGM
jgi:hypothetical protein